MTNKRQISIDEREAWFLVMILEQSLKRLQSLNMRLRLPHWDLEEGLAGRIDAMRRALGADPREKLEPLGIFAMFDEIFSGAQKVEATA